MEHRSINHNARTALLAALLTVALLAAPAAGKSSAPKHTPKGKQAYSEITFYANTTIGVSSFNVVPPLARLSQTVTFFGAINVIDAVITSGPEPDSPALGSLKGFLVLDNNDNATGPGFGFVGTAIFNDASGFGAGSSISYQSYTQVSLPVREQAITGGTGKFRLATGWAEVSTASGEGFLSQLLLFVSHVVYYDLDGA